MKNIMSIAIIYHDYRGITTVHITAAQAKEGMAHIQCCRPFYLIIPTLYTQGHQPLPLQRMASPDSDWSPWTSMYGPEALLA